MDHSQTTVTDSLIITENHGYLDIGGRTIHTTFYLPSMDSVQFAVACAEPFGEEKRPAARMFVRLARKLARKGIAVARFDFSDTGDSQHLASGASWNAWAEELQSVLQNLIKTTSASNTAFIGARAGALTAAMAAQSCNPDMLILIEPLLSGTEMLKELRRREQLKAMEIKLENIRKDGEEFAGVFVSSQMATEIECTDLAELCSTLPESCSISLLRVSGLPNFPAAWHSLVSSVTSHKNALTNVIRDKPFWGQTEYFESDRVIDSVLSILEN